MVLPGNSPLKYKNCKHIFSGIQPTGVLHLGNYFGAVKQWVSLQNAGHDVVLSIVDQHAITVSQKRCDLLHNTLTMAASLIACGIDPEKSILFQQSHVPEHSELNVLLRSVAHTALLARQAHYKDKLKTLKHVPSLGLFSYPVLQAADILLYETTHVPVGDDQKQHIQLARQIARQFNAKYGKDILRLPQAIILDDSLARVKSLCQPNKKMSKSDVNPNSRIEILDSPDLIRHKVNSAYTAEYYGNIACTPEDSQAAVANLMSIHSVVSGIDLESLNKKYANESIDEYKNIVGNAVAEHMAPIKEKADLLLKEPEGLLQILEWGAKKAQIRAQNTIGKIHQKLGFSLW
ncbi:hypothetical protein HAZT_HAZT002055 [Hyalella azteca]|uniref:tryptophan--tRNA ligase n=1 Tax=Hyalella azteca TaxID=294128 RepID=A0A6A0HBF1_HYAAZ|nr:hypothetical protein HAZT_HAZT002055 [Hyalella azteca]